MLEATGSPAPCPPPPRPSPQPYIPAPDNDGLMMPALWGGPEGGELTNSLLGLGFGSAMLMVGRRAVLLSCWPVLLACAGPCSAPLQATCACTWERPCLLGA